MLTDYAPENLFFKHFLDNSKLTYSYKWNQSSNTTILNKESVLQNINYDYSLTFSRDNKWYPFKELFNDNEQNTDKSN